jgi:hypothetical protein
VELRGDFFNLFNITNINARNASAQFNDPTAMVLANNQFNADGSLNPARLQPRNSGFGAATGAREMRNLQFQLRFQF